MELEIDRLTLRLSGLSELEARRLAELVGHHLAEATPPATATRTDSLRLALTPHTGEGLDSLARRIVDEMLRGLARSVP